MIAARNGRTDITNILLEGKHIDPDIQENVRQYLDYCTMNTLISHHREQDGRLSISLLREETQILQKLYSRQEPMLTSKTRFMINLHL